MKFWWVNTVPNGNFGDILTPCILDYFNIPFEFSNDFEAISIGSIAKFARDKTIVLGSGIMGANQYLCPTADWRFVRGPQTRTNVIESGGTCPEIYGDPALLLPLMCDESKKEYDVGLVPHYMDYDQVKEQYPDYPVVQLRTVDPLETAKEITKCRTIISSSLHGIICAHAYGIPAAWVPFSNKLKGDGVKFKDHYEAVGLEAVASSMEDPQFTVGTFDTAMIEDIFRNLE